MTMKCPKCNAEVHEEDKFCGECGENLRREIEIASKWKWGSMFASLVLTFIFWMICLDESYNENGLIILLISGFPATIYFMHKERTGKMKYGLAWILFPILVLLFSLDAGGAAFGGFLFMAIPAIAIDVIYVIYKTK